MKYDIIYDSSGKRISLDQKQKHIASKLSNISHQIIKKKFSLVRFFFSKKVKKDVKSLYIYGEVGRGKSMLMQHFFKNVNIEKKLYYHFNDFLQKVHEELHILRKSKNNVNLMKQVTEKIIGSNILLCFDEFQVEDVSDAMILEKIFSQLVDKGVITIVTSNFHPRSLYKNGLQRNMFLRFIDNVLYKNYEILCLDNDVDYRIINSSFGKKRYFYPISEENKLQIDRIFFNFVKKGELRERILKVKGRSIIVKKSSDKVACFNFEEICKSHLSSVDYKAICEAFDVIFLLNVPILSKEDRDEARRLTLFIDEIYEKKIDLFILADGNVNEIYRKGIGSKIFKRTASRMGGI